MDSSSSACPYHSVPRSAQLWVGAGCFSAWGDSQWCWREKHPSIAALSHVSSVKWSLCKGLAGASLAPHYLSARPRLGILPMGIARGSFVLPWATSPASGRDRQKNQGIFPPTWSKWCHLTPLEKTNLFVKAESSGSCCFRMLLF